MEESTLEIVSDRSPLRIVHLIYDHPSNPWVGGGGALRAVMINRILARRGHRITMVCGRYPGCPERRTEDGYEVRTFGTDRSYLGSRFTYALNARRVFCDTPCDLAVDDTSAYSLSMPYFATRVPRIAIVHHLFGAHVLRKNGLLGAVPFVFERLNLMAYRDFIVGSPSVRDQIRHLAGPRANITLIPYGVDDFLFEAQSVEGDYLLYFGRIDMYNKGIDVLLDAYAQFHAQCPATRLVLAGGGKDEAELCRRVAQHSCKAHIEVRGRTVGLEKRRLLERALFVCMPSRYEGWGIVALEAAACMKAVIASNIPGLRDAVLHDITGLLVPPDNPAALATAMVRLTTDQSLRRRLAEHGARRAREFRWEAIAAQQERVYQAVAMQRATNTSKLRWKQPTE